MTRLHVFLWYVVASSWTPMLREKGALSWTNVTDHHRYRIMDILLLDVPSKTRASLAWDCFKLWTVIGCRYLHDLPSRETLFSVQHVTSSSLLVHFDSIDRDAAAALHGSCLLSCRWTPKPCLNVSDFVVTLCTWLNDRLIHCVSGEFGACILVFW